MNATTRSLPFLFLFFLFYSQAFTQIEIAGTSPLEWQGDIASRLIDSCDQFLLREIEKSTENREKFWNRKYDSGLLYEQSVEKNRKRLAQMIGLTEDTATFSKLENLGIVARGKGYIIYQVRWPAFGQVHGEGLLVLPESTPVLKGAVVVPDADQTPEEILGLSGNLDPGLQTGRIFAEKGMIVLIPTLINRKMHSLAMTNREFIYRSAYVLGRHIIGYEVQKILKGVDWIKTYGAEEITIAGWGEGGLLALYAGAIDTGIDQVEVAGYFGSRQAVWGEPADRNIFGLLEQFGDAEIGSLIAPRRLVIHNDTGAPEIELVPGTKGKPGRLTIPGKVEMTSEIDRLQALTHNLDWTVEHTMSERPSGKVAIVMDLPDAAMRHDRQLAELDRHNQWLLTESSYTRQAFMSNLKFDNQKTYQESTEPYRQYFAEEVIGQFSYPLSDFNARSRPFILDNSGLKAYEIVLDVFPGLFAYGILILPPDLEPADRRPVIVCQHGLEGRPQSTIGEEDYKYYKAFAVKLAERGYITFAPQNLYIFEDRFRTLQFKANCIKKTLFSMMVPQHQQITNWLSTLPYVDSTRIAFYGLSYGGKSAMRIPPLVSKYCLSICSADFNEWVWKNASSRSPYSYVRTGEYEIFEWNLGSTFNYAEMAALIAPRPFMVERGHFDGVAPDEMVAHEYAKVRHLYNAQLNIGDKTEIEWFAGPHTINGKGTFAFLDKHLQRHAKKKDEEESK